MAKRTNMIVRDEFEMRARRLISNHYKPVEMPGGFKFDPVEQLKSNARSQSSVFKTGKYDNKGFRKFYFQVIKPAKDVARKFIDIDTKDYILEPVGTSKRNMMRVWFKQRKFRKWMKDEGFATILNDLGEEYPGGHVVVKKVKKKVSPVSLFNLRVHQDVDFLKNMPEFAEVHPMTRSELLATNWDTDEILGRDKDEQKFVIYEVYFKKDNGYKQVIFGDMFTKRNSNGGYVRGTEALINDKDSDVLPALRLYEDDISEKQMAHRYFETKWENVRGRWLGRGFDELLEDSQIAANETENLSRKGLAINSLTLLQTRDEALEGQNVFSDATNGDIITVDQELSKVPLEERNLPAYNADRARWDDNRRKLTFSFESGTGESMPSRTPLGSHTLSTQMVESYYSKKRENLGIMTKEIVYALLDDFDKDSRSAHTLTFSASDEDIQKLARMEIEVRLSEIRAKHALKTGFFPSQEQMDNAKERLMAQARTLKNRVAVLPKNAYVDTKSEINLIVTGESVNVEKQNEAFQMIVNLWNNNPEIMQNTTLKTVLFKLLGGNGISPVDLEMLSEEDIKPSEAKQGGSLPKIAKGGQSLTQSQSVI